MSSYSTSLEAFKNTFGDISELPYCSGTVLLDKNTATLFYRSGEKTESVNFVDATDAQLTSLAEACQHATFGVNHKDVLDESYRKAGKLDATDFATQFSPLTSGIIDTVRESLFQAEHADKSIKVELYKLNVYGPGSFFKAHIDTPRSDTMFGSLVLVLPTAHEGGSLIFRHRGQERTFDTAGAVSQVSPHIAFVAFFSDVEHEVSVVTSGYRVTLTYNLYFADHAPPVAEAPITFDQELLDQLQATLSNLLADPDFLPKGGLLGFGLSHKYPFDPSSTRLKHMEKYLKGNDARISRLCKGLSLKISLKIVYQDKYDRGMCLLDRFVNIDGEYMEESLFSFLKREAKGTRIYDFGGPPPDDEDYEDDDEDEEDEGKDDDRREGGSDAVPVVWVKPLSKSNTFDQNYVAYGNEASLGCAYGEVCLVAKIEVAKKRNGV